MYNEDLALNNLQWKQTKTNQILNSLFAFHTSFISLGKIFFFQLCKYEGR